MAMSSKISMLSKKDLGEKLRHFRLKVLNIPHLWKMGAEFGVSGDKYGNWERGRSYPNGAEMLAILRRCDKESLTEFGIDITKLGEQSQSPLVSESETDLIGHTPPARKRSDARRPRKHEPLRTE